MCSTLHLKFVDARVWVSGGTHQQESNLETEYGVAIATYGSYLASICTVLYLQLQESVIIELLHFLCSYIRKYIAICLVFLCVFI